jgi:hypothetical protein
MSDSTSSYATAGIALRVSGALKHHHHNKVETPSVGTRKVMLGVKFDISWTYDILYYMECVCLRGFSRFWGVTIDGIWISEEID